MKRIFFLLTLTIFAYAQGENEDFITQDEYGKKLYEDPRSIGCIKCHGKSGNGGFIAKYSHNGKHFTITAPRINNLDIETFKKALREGKGLMPKYYLSEEEINAIFAFINQHNK